MKTKLRTLIGPAVLGLALLFNNIPAWAGQALRFEVEIRTSDPYSSSAFGTLTGARYSTDSTQYIGCYRDNRDEMIKCSARDRTGNTLVCQSPNGFMLGALDAMTDSSTIGFSVNTVTGQCKTLSVSNYSIYLR